MKVLIHSLIFSPDGVSTAYLYNDIALAFKKKGHEVVVVTTTPHFNVLEEQLERQPLRWGVPGLYKKSVYNDIPVYHVPQKKFKSTLLRLLGFVYWHIVSFFMVLCIRNVDVIVSPSPPLTIGQLNLWLKRLKGAKVIYNVQEIYPDILGMKEGMAFKCLSAMEKRIYDRSDAVTTIDQVFYDTIVDRFDDPSRLHIIPNFVDTKLYAPDASTALPKDLFPDTDSLKVLYAGNIGIAQDWEPLVELAKRTKDAAVEYFVIGEGARRDYLVNEKQQHGLEKLHILPYQSRELMPSILAYCDMHFIFMSPEMDMQGFPSKVYTVMACGKPLLVCSGEGTPIVEFLSDLNCAKIVTSHVLKERVDQITAWICAVSREELKLMGENGMEIIREKYAKEAVTDEYVKLVESLMA